MTKNEIARFKRFVATYHYYRVGSGYLRIYPDKLEPDSSLDFVSAFHMRRKNETYITLGDFYRRVLAKYGENCFKTHVRNVNIWVQEVNGSYFGPVARF